MFLLCVKNYARDYHASVMRDTHTVPYKPADLSIRVIFRLKNLIDLVRMFLVLTLWVIKVNTTCNKSRYYGRRESNSRRLY